MVIHDRKELMSVQMKTGVEQAVYAIMILSMLPDKAVLPGEAISEQLKTSPTYSQKLLRRLVSENLIASVPGAKGGFKLQKNPEEIRIYDIYLAVEGHQSLYSSSGILDDLLELEEERCSCLLTDLMDEAESEWKKVLKRQTIADLRADIHAERFKEKLVTVQQLIEERMVL